MVFAVQDGYVWIATVHHVVRTLVPDGDDKQALNLRVLFRQRPLASLPAEHHESATPEVAVIKVKDPGIGFDFARLGNPEELKRGAKIYAVGHARNENWAVTWQPGSLGDRKSTTLDLQSPYIEPGHSGGAVIDEDRRIIGLANSRGGAQAQALRIDHLVKVIQDDLKLPVQLSAARTGKSSPPPAAPRFETDKAGLRYVWIPSGSFRMGCSENPVDTDCDKADEYPAHAVTITKGFWMGETEVPIGAYEKYRAQNKAVPALAEKDDLGRKINTGTGNLQMPAVAVTWQEAADYCAWAGAGSSKLRLPTEAEWEYTARAGTTGKHYAEPLTAIVWLGDNSGRPIDSAKLWVDSGRDTDKYAARLFANGNGPHPVGDVTKRPNAWGLRDILGNVWEWTNDWYAADYYKASPSADPAGPERMQYRVLRGGSWDDFPSDVRVSDRDRIEPTYRNISIGFRCAGEFR